MYRTRRRTGVLALVVVALLTMSGCINQQQDKDSYADTEGNYLEGCIDRVTADNADIEAGAEGTEGATEIADPETYCQCTFDALEEDIPFERFKEVNSDLRENGGPLPEDFVEATAPCDDTPR